MTSTLKKSEALENKTLDKFLELEVHLPNSHVKNYQVSKNGKLKDTLKFICDKEHLKAKDHYLHHMQLTDDSLDMNLRVRDIRTHVIRLVSKSDRSLDGTDPGRRPRSVHRPSMFDGGRPSSTAILEKVSQSKAKKNGGLCSYFRSRFSRKPKNSRHYNSAPSVLRYNDNIFMVERQTEQKKSENTSRDDVFQPANNETRQLPSSSEKTQIHSSNGQNMSPTLVYSTKRKAPLPPVAQNLKQQNGEGLLTKPAINGETKKHIKRRAPSPPRDPVKPDLSLETNVKPESSNVKPPRPPRPSSLSSSESNPASPLDSEPTNIPNKTLDNLEKDRKLLPVFIPPPPPDSPPPPLEECETPVGPVDMDFDEDAISAVEVPSETNLPEEKLISNSIVTKETEHSNEEIAENGVDKESPGFIKEDDKEKIEEENEIKEVSKEKEEKEEIEEKDKKDRTNSTEEHKETSERTNNLDEHVSDEELKMRESLKNLAPEQLQMLLNAQQSSTTAQNQQLPFNLQNQQYFAMHQRQQILQNLLIQQMLEQQMSQQTPTSMLAMHPMAGAAPPMQYIGGAVPHIQSVGGAVPHIQSVGGAVPHIQSVGGAVPHIQSVGGAVPHIHPVSGNVAPIQYVGVTAAPHVQVNGGVPSIQSVGVVSPTQSVGAVPPVHNVPSDVPPVQSVSVNSIQEKSKVEEKPEESNDDSPSSVPPPVKDEALVNRPLFKKMLAQVSQGKSKGIPNVSSTEQVATSGTPPPVSQNAKIEKVPSTYVESAGKNVPVIKDETEKKSPVSLGNIGRKSSYVESAIDRNKVDGSISSPTHVKIEDDETVPVATSHTITRSSNAIDLDKFDRTSEDVKVIENISSPTEKKFPVTFSHSGGLSSSVNSETTQRKTEAVVPAVAEKPKFRRHLSEPTTLPKPKPVVGPKPMEFPIRKNKTLPKTKRSEPLKISLSLSPEERMMLPNFSDVGKTSNDQQKPNVATTSNVQNKHNVSAGSSPKVQSKLNVVEPEEKPSIN